MRWLRPLVLLFGMLLMLSAGAGHATDEEKSALRHYVTAPAAPGKQTVEQAEAKSAGCITCHTKSDAATMHVTPAVRLGCTD